MAQKPTDSTQIFTHIYSTPTHVQGAPTKTIPLEKFYISTNVSDFKTEFTDFTEEEDSGHICSEFHYNISLDSEITVLFELKSTFM